MRTLTLSILTLLFVAAPASAQESWKLDPFHTEVSFEIPYMGVSSVIGSFKTVAGKVNLDPNDLKSSVVDITIQAASIDTGIAKRDKHLRSADFFDVKKFPTVTYKSKKVEADGEGRLKVTGTLTMHGVAKEVVLRVKGPTEAVLNPAGTMVRGAKASADIDRRDFGLTWNKGLAQAGGKLVGNDVEITIRTVLLQPKKTAAKKK